MLEVEFEQLELALHLSTVGLSMSLLPLDIIETVIDILSQDPSGFPAINTCSLVCSAFLPICRKHIFASIILHDRFDVPISQTGCIRRLNSLLSVTPELAGYIRHLELNYFPAKHNGFKDESETFHKITGLRSLTIRQYFDADYPAWNKSRLRPLLLHFFRLPSLTTLKLFSVIKFTVADLAPCVNLKHFEFGNFTTAVTSRFNLLQTPIRLRKLSIGTISAVIPICAVKCADGTPFIDISGITDLSLQLRHCEDDNKIVPPRALLCQCTRLINIELIVSESSLRWIGLARILTPSMQTLKHIAVYARPDYDIAAGDPLCGVVEELEQMSSENVIENITIQIGISSGVDIAGLDIWSRFDKIMAQAGWPRLRKVSLTITLEQYLDPQLFGVEEKDYLGFADTQFPWLSSKESPFFEFEIIKKKHWTER